jgi:hypothetical protein
MQIRNWCAIKTSRKCEAWASIFVEMIAQAFLCTYESELFRFTTGFLSSFCRMRSIHAFLLLSFSKEGRKMLKNIF